jgi:hypothetical protein
VLGYGRGETMNKIVFEHYPASKLPEDMRASIDPTSTVTVVVTVEEPPTRKTPTLEEIFARRQPPFRTKEEIDDEWRRQRDEWE